MWVVGSQNARMKKCRANCNVCCPITFSVICLLFVFLFFTSISEDNDMIVEFTNADPYAYNCTKICRKEYVEQFQDGICCTVGNLTFCETKEDCRLEKLADLADDKETQTQNIYVFSALSLFCGLVGIHILKKNKIRERALVPNGSAGVEMNYSLKDTIVSIFSRKKSNQLKQEQQEQEKALTKCVVCVQEFDKDNVVVPRCLHRFHERCISQIISSTKVCPICRTLF